MVKTAFTQPPFMGPPVLGQALCWVLGAGHEVCARPWSLPPATYRPGGIVLFGRGCDGDEIDAVERRGGAGGHPSQPGGGRAGGGEAAEAS